MLAQDTVVNEMYQEQCKRIVKIYNVNYLGNLVSQSTGTGIFWNDKYHIITANHVVSVHPMWSQKIFIEFKGSDVKYECKVLKRNVATDLAIIIPIVSPLRHFKQCKYVVKYPNVGSRVFAIGHPYGSPFSITSGIVSAVHQDINKTLNRVSPWPTKVIQVDTPINPGNSGGPVFNVLGQVVGICSYKVNGDGVAFIIPTEDVVSLINSL